MGMTNAKKIAKKWGELQESYFISFQTRSVQVQDNSTISQEQEQEQEQE